MMGKISRKKQNKRRDSLAGALSPLIRQALQPKEIRLNPPQRHSLQDIKVLQKVLQDTVGPRNHGAKSRPPAAQELFPPDVWRPLLADLGTGLWRLRQRLVDPETDQPRDEMRRAYRHFESVWDVLAEAGIQIKGHTGEYLPEHGFSELHASAYQPTPGLKRERVIDTIKPTVSIRRNGLNQDILIQRGEVIVGTPEAPVPNLTPPEIAKPKEPS